MVSDKAIPLKNLLILTVPESLTSALCNYFMAGDGAQGRTCGGAGEYLSSAS